MVVGCSEGTSIVNDAGSRLEVVIEAWAGQSVLTVKKNDSSEGDSLSCFQIHLKAISLKAARPLNDFNVPFCDQNAIGSDLLNPVSLEGDTPPITPEGERSLGESVCCQGEDANESQNSEPDSSQQCAPSSW
jgi:hypothetical protein